MSNTPFMQLYVADYLADTRGLTTEQHGAYLLLLMTMWKAGAKLPDDPKKLARIAGVTARRWHLIWPEISGFFDVQDGFVTQKRLDREYQKAVSKSELRSACGSLGGKAKALKNKNASLAKARVLPKHSSESESDREEKNPPNPPRGETPVEILSAVASPEVAAEFVAHRKTGRSKFTPHAARLIVKKLQGCADPDAVLNLSIERGWSGVFPESREVEKAKPANGNWAGAFGFIPEVG